MLNNIRLGPKPPWDDPKWVEDGNRLAEEIVASAERQLKETLAPKGPLTARDLYDAMLEVMRTVEGCGKPSRVEDSFRYEPVVDILNRIIEERSRALPQRP